MNAKKGGITKPQCAVEKRTKDGKEFYDAGVVIVAERANHADTMTVNGQAVPPETVELLRSMLGLTEDIQLTRNDRPRK